MTVDDIVRELKNKFYGGLYEENYKYRNKLHVAISVDATCSDFENWLKQKLTEYGNEKEREGQAKVYQLIETRLAYDKFFKEKSKEPDCDKVCLEIFKDCQKKLDKLKKLEGE